MAKQQKVTLLVLRKFTDMEANKDRKPKETFTASPERAKEIQENLKHFEKGKGAFVSVVEVPKK